ncbi:MAG TPA: hypothetical protein VJ654_14610 [Noviherbaspirillum sp.]|nr:hypothetical protein [Noviherbaspirillum sp.]
MNTAERIAELEWKNEVLREALREVKEWDINGWTERGFALPTELRDKIHALLGDTPAAADAGGQDIKEMVNRFLGWELPETFAPDCFISFDSERAEQHESWPIGTNLLTADQAKEMFEYCLRSTANSAAHKEGAK